jgi:hypothetical protein
MLYPVQTGEPIRGAMDREAEAAKIPDRNKKLAV